MSCDGVRNVVTVWCYECHTPYQVEVCDEFSRLFHREDDYERGKREHAQVCEPQLLDHNGELPLSSWPCGCVCVGPCFHPRKKEPQP